MSVPSKLLQVFHKNIFAEDFACVFFFLRCPSHDSTIRAARLISEVLFLREKVDENGLVTGSFCSPLFSTQRSPFPSFFSRRLAAYHMRRYFLFCLSPPCPALFLSRSFFFCSGLSFSLLTSQASLSERPLLRLLSLHTRNRMFLLRQGQ